MKTSCTIIKPKGDDKRRREAIMMSLSVCERSEAMMCVSKRDESRARARINGTNERRIKWSPEEVAVYVSEKEIKI